jgi:hypothetical protein
MESGLVALRCFPVDDLDFELAVAMLMNDEACSAEDLQERLRGRWPHVRVTIRPPYAPLGEPMVIYVFRDGFLGGEPADGPGTVMCGRPEAVAIAEQCDAVSADAGPEEIAFDDPAARPAR